LFSSLLEPIVETTAKKKPADRLITAHTRQRVRFTCGEARSSLVI
jgi:hypothetical protein